MASVLRLLVCLSMVALAGKQHCGPAEAVVTVLISLPRVRRRLSKYLARRHCVVVARGITMWVGKRSQSAFGASRIAGSVSTRKRTVNTVGMRGESTVKRRIVKSSNLRSAQAFELCVEQTWLQVRVPKNTATNTTGRGCVEVGEG